MATLKVVVAVYDSAVRAYSTPFFCPSRGYAIRAFTDEVNRAAPDNALHAHPDDYDLHQLGFWDEESGEFSEVKEPLLRGKDALKKVE